MNTCKLIVISVREIMARKRNRDAVATTEHGSNSEGLVPYEIQRLKMYVWIQLRLYNG